MPSTVQAIQVTELLHGGLSFYLTNPENNGA